MKQLTQVSFVIRYYRAVATRFQSRSQNRVFGLILVETEAENRGSLSKPGVETLNYSIKYVKQICRNYLYDIHLFVLSQRQCVL